MQRILSLVLLLTVSIASFSQTPFPEADEVDQFFNTTTLVVLEDDPWSLYNPQIKKAVNENWKITPFGFISATEFNEKRRDPAYSFIVLTSTRFDRDKAGTIFNFINLLLGKDVGRIEYMPEFCAIPLSVEDAEDALYAHKLGIVVRFLQAHVEHIKEDPSLKGKKYLKYYNKFIPEAINKTILVAKDDLVEELQTQKAVEKYYPENLKVASDEEVDEAIKAEAENTLVLHGNNRSGQGVFLTILPAV